MPDCVVHGCGLATSRYRRGMCNTHYLRVIRHGDPNARVKAANGEVSSKRCLVDGCETHAKAKGYCGMHFQRLKRTGDPLVVRRPARSTDAEKRAAKARAQARYKETPYGRLRSRFNATKMRAMAKKQAGISKEEFQVLWATPACGICGADFDSDDDKSLDHKKPLSLGGDHTIANLQLAHLGCNQRKSNSFVCA